MTLQDIDQVVEAIRGRTAHKPRIGLILGSGLGAVADMVEKPDIIPTASLPLWPRSTVLGHQGRLLLGSLAGHEVMVLQGRTHYYEGYSMSQVTLPVRVMKRLGVEYLIVTNAAGAIDPSFSPGDLMLITDHIGLISMTGLNPLIGPNIDEFGVRFPDMSQAYDRQLMAVTREVAAEKNILLREGVYTCLSGPSFETPADLRFLHGVGSSAVGMSTVPEVIVARHAGMRVLGISGISNKANLDGNTVTTHEEVLQAGDVIAPKMKALILGVLSKIN
ncbi:MAG: purine-nucleoside phosphorylase [Anaerolineae bacterium]|nr:purine-nucleoside phosphorylase [Anaerolineae bacterium]